MPWEAQSFKAHNHSLSTADAGKAAHQANAILKKTGDEGLAISVANKHAKSPSKSLYGGKKAVKGYAEGGKVDAVLDATKSFEAAMESARNSKSSVERDTAHQAADIAIDHLRSANHKPGKYPESQPEGYPPPVEQVPAGMAGGGQIKQVAGKSIGKDDGMIPAQRGEYVIRKSAVKKLGTAALDQINRGHLPRSSKLYGGKGASHG